MLVATSMGILRLCGISTGRKLQSAATTLSYLKAAICMTVFWLAVTACSWKPALSTLCGVSAFRRVILLPFTPVRGQDKTFWAMRSTVFECLIRANAYPSPAVRPFYWTPRPYD